MATQASINAVATVFQNVFGRAPNSQEATGWANQLDAGATSAQLAAALANSPEGAALVSGLYTQRLGRTSVSASDIAGGQAYLAQDTTNGLATLRHSVAFSTESQANVQAVYQTVLGRTASAAEVTAAETALDNGATLAQLVSAAAASPELTANLAAAYQTAFSSAPPAAVVTFLQQQIAGGAVFTQLATALTSLAGGSGGPGADIAIPNGTFILTPIETVNNQTLKGTATSITVNGASVSIPDTFNPAGSLLAGASPSGAAPVAAATDTAASAASLVQLANPATVGITPTLHAG